MEGDMNKLLVMITAEMKKQGELITKMVTENLTKTIDEKMKLLSVENQQLKDEVVTLKSRIMGLEIETRKKNLILHGIPETEKDKSELLVLILEILNKQSEKANQENWDKWELSKFYRIGKMNSKRIRPILISVTLEWRRDSILKNNKKFPQGIYATEDLPKETLNKRKELLPKLNEERSKGKIAFFSYDKLVIKEKPKDKRKRSLSNSPGKGSIQENNQNPSKINTINNFLRTRTRSPVQTLGKSSEQVDISQ